MSPLTRRIFKNTEKKSIPPSTTNQKNGSTFISPDIENVQISNIKLNKDELLEEQKLLYSDDYYEQFVKKILDDPQLDKK